MYIYAELGPRVSKGKQEVRTRVRKESGESPEFQSEHRELRRGPEYGIPLQKAVYNFFCVQILLIIYYYAQQI
jgi:hypothetical protein